MFSYRKAFVENTLSGQGYNQRKHAITFKLRLTRAFLGSLFLFLAAYTLSLPLWKTAPELHNGIQAPVGARHPILDRNGRRLAHTIDFRNLYFDLEYMGRTHTNPQHALLDVVAILSDLDETQLGRRIATRQNSHVTIATKRSPFEIDQVMRLGIAGVYYRRAEGRIYPYGADYAHVIGHVRHDNIGGNGIESTQDVVLRDPAATSLVLTIDHLVQEQAAAILRKAKAEWKASHACTIVMDVNTSEIIAMVSLPDYDPNLFFQTEFDWNNHCFHSVYEPGSIFKLFTFATALEEQTVRLHQRFDIPDSLTIGNFTIRDFRPAGRPLTAQEIFTQSSNIGAAKIALTFGQSRQLDHVWRYGLLNQWDIGLTGTYVPTIQTGDGRPSRTALMTISYGHGVVMNMLNLATTTAGLVNGGVLRPPVLIRPPGISSNTGLRVQQFGRGKRIVSEDVSTTLRELLSTTVIAGTGKAGAVEGYGVGGKTGTAEQASAAGYSDDRVQDFYAGIFPIDNPQYLVLSLIGQPQPKIAGGSVTAGVVVAPVVGETIRVAGPLLGVTGNVDSAALQ